MNVGELLRGDWLDGFIVVGEEPSLTVLLDAYKICGEFQCIAATLRLNGINTRFNLLASLWPAVFPYDWENGEHTPAAAFKISLEVQRHHLNAVVNNKTSEVSRAHSLAVGIYNHLAAALFHIATGIVEVGAIDVFGTANDDVVGRIDTITTSAVSAEQVVPAVNVENVGSLAVDGNVHGFCAGLAACGLGVEFDDADIAEIRAVTYKQPVLLLHIEETSIDCVAVFNAVGSRNFLGYGVFEIGRLGVESLVPHCEDFAVVTAAETAACCAVRHQVTVANLQNVGSRAAAGTLCAAVPCPAAVVGNQSAAAGAKCVILAITFRQCRWVVDVGCAYLRRCSRNRQRSKYWEYKLFRHFILP